MRNFVESIRKLEINSQITPLYQLVYRKIMLCSVAGYDANCLSDVHDTWQLHLIKCHHKIRMVPFYLHFVWVRNLKYLLNVAINTYNLKQKGSFHKQGLIVHESCVRLCFFRLHAVLCFLQRGDVWGKPSCVFKLCSLPLKYDNE